MNSSLNYYELYDKLHCNDFILQFCFGGEYWKVFMESLLRALWLAEKQPIMGCYQYICRTTKRVCVFQTNIPFFLFDVNDVTQNLDCYQNRLQVQVVRYIQRSSCKDTLCTWGPRIILTSNLWICKDQPLKLHGTERTVTKMNTIAKSAENTSFCNSSSFFIYFFKCKPFSQPNCCFVSFSLVTSPATVSLIFPYTSNVDFILFSMGKIPTL